MSSTLILYTFLTDSITLHSNSFYYKPNLPKYGNIWICSTLGVSLSPISDWWRQTIRNNLCCLQLQHHLNYLGRYCPIYALLYASHIYTQGVTKLTLILHTHHDTTLPLVWVCPQTHKQILFRGWLTKNFLSGYS